VLRLVIGPERRSGRKGADVQVLSNLPPNWKRLRPVESLVLPAPSCGASSRFDAVIRNRHGRIPELALGYVLIGWIAGAVAAGMYLALATGPWWWGIVLFVGIGNGVLLLLVSIAFLRCAIADRLRRHSTRNHGMDDRPHEE